MTGSDLQLLPKYRNSIWTKETEIKYCSNTKMFLRYTSFIVSYTENEPNFTQRNNLIWQKTGVWHWQGSEFQWPFKACYWNQVCFKDLNRIQGLFKTTTKIQDLFKIVQTMKLEKKKDFVILNQGHQKCSKMPGYWTINWEEEDLGMRLSWFARDNKNGWTFHSFHQAEKDELLAKNIAKTVRRQQEGRH